MATSYDSDLAKKFNLKSGMEARVVAKPEGVELSGVSTTESADAEGVIVFVRTLADVEASSEPVVDAAKADRIAWLAYPKGKQLGTDLNRDILWQHMKQKGVRPVRQISIDDTWSALRFRNAK
jgi:hypothetical protein